MDCLSPWIDLIHGLPQSMDCLSPWIDLIHGLPHSMDCLNPWIDLEDFLPTSGTFLLVGSNKWSDKCAFQGNSSRLGNPFCLGVHDIPPSWNPLKWKIGRASCR